MPAVQLAAALQQPAEEWQRQYRCAPPQAEDLVVMYSRAHTRAAWAAQVAADQGLRNCFVLLQVRSVVHAAPGAYAEAELLGVVQGISAWHLHPGAHAYRAYGEDDPPPEPEPSQVEAESEVPDVPVDPAHAGLSLAGAPSGPSRGKEASYPVWPAVTQLGQQEQAHSLPHLYLTTLQGLSSVVRVL